MFPDRADFSAPMLLEPSVDGAGLRKNSDVNTDPFVVCSGVFPHSLDGRVMVAHNGHNHYVKIGLPP